jgi:PAS domain S-box-containing protein
VTVLDADMRVLVWNRRAEDLWGLRQEETVGQHFLNLDIGLPTGQFRSLIRSTLAGEAGPHEMVLPAVNRRGRTIMVRVAGSPLSGADGAATGAILLMEQDGIAQFDERGGDKTGAGGRGNVHGRRSQHRDGLNATHNILRNEPLHRPLRTRNDRCLGAGRQSMSSLNPNSNHDLKRKVAANSRAIPGRQVAGVCGVS